MDNQRVLVSERVRKINGSFAFIEHHFLQDGYWSSLNHQELVMYFFLVMVGDRSGVSYYSYDKICSFLSFTLEEYIDVRNALIDKDLIAFDGARFQVLSLPVRATQSPPLFKDRKRDGQA